MPEGLSEDASRVTMVGLAPRTGEMAATATERYLKRVMVDGILDIRRKECVWKTNVSTLRSERRCSRETNWDEEEKVRLTVNHILYAGIGRGQGMMLPPSWQPVTLPIREICISALAGGGDRKNMIG